jgi:hypothetical protein
MDPVGKFGVIVVSVLPINQPPFTPWLFSNHSETLPQGCTTNQYCVPENKTGFTAEVIVMSCCVVVRGTFRLSRSVPGCPAALVYSPMVTMVGEATMSTGTWIVASVPPAVSRECG